MSIGLSQIDVMSTHSSDFPNFAVVQIDQVILAQNSS